MSLVQRVTLSLITLSLSLLAAPASAQEVAVPASATSTAVVAPTDVTPAPVAANTTVGVRRIAEANTTEAAIHQQRESRPVALMIVGGAGILVGSVIGDDAGTIVMVAGAVILMVGLFRYLQ